MYTVHLVVFTNSLHTKNERIHCTLFNTTLNHRTIHYRSTSNKHVDVRDNLTCHKSKFYAELERYK